jgi:hypothetical protein
MRQVAARWGATCISELAGLLQRIAAGQAQQPAKKGVQKTYDDGH